MNRRREDVQKIERALAQARRGVAAPEPGAFFHQNVMARILEAATSSTASAPNGLYAGRIAWRFALVGYLVVILFAAQFLMADVDSQTLLTRLILEDSSGPDLIHAFEILL